MIHKTILTGICIAAALLTAVSCRKHNETEDYAAVAGEWHMISSGSVKDIDIYIGFHTDKTFIMYQKSGDEILYSVYKGSYTLSGGILSGQYDDGSGWASSYKASFSDNEMTLVSQTATPETTVYKKTAFPEYLKEKIHGNPS